MRNASGHHEQMPGGVEILNAIHREEYDAEGVSETTCAKPEKTVGADGVHQGTGCENHDPSLKEIDSSRGCLKLTNRNALEEDARERE